MRYIFLLLLLISCNVRDCRVEPNATIQPKVEAKTDSKTIDAKSESKSIVDQFRDIRDNLQPGAQLKCNF